MNIFIVLQINSREMFDYPCFLPPFFYHMHSRNSTSLLRARATPLSIDTSHDGLRSMYTPPRPLSSEFDHLTSSPVNFQSRESAGVAAREPDESSFLFDQSDHVSTLSTIAKHHLYTHQSSIKDSNAMPNTSGLLAPEQPSFTTGRYHTREDRLRALRQNATNAFLSGLVAFIGEKLMASTGG